MDLWEQIKDRLRNKLPWESYQSWFARTSLHSQQGDTLFVAVPSREAKDWIEREYATVVESVITEIRLPISRIAYVVPNGSHIAQDVPITSETLFGPPTSQLNARYTFDNFVVGSCNQFAHAAAKAVADHPARAYNPLFIYGGVGMGKTHLIHAVGHALSSAHSTTRVVYTTAERFMNQLITCIRTDRMPFFHMYYRSAEILLVDDVHILGGKERTQEEFFHTFNDLYDHQRQIVLSSDQPPKNIPNLVDRLRSRFEWGLIVDVQAPDLETKLAILDKRAASEQITLPEDVRNFIATKTKSNVRELEGALVKLMAYSSVTGSPITLKMARQVLRYFTATSDRKVTIESVIKAVCERYGLQPHQLRQKTNQRNISYPRQVAMFLVKELTHSSLPEIGRAFGGKHHTTVLHSVHKIERERASNPDLHRTIQTIIDSFN
jgi:chromosomal replication initiator protein